MSAEQRGVQRSDIAAAVPDIQEVMRWKASRTLHGGSQQEVPDVVQDAWVKILTQRPGYYAHLGHLRGAAATTVRNQALDNIRRRTVRERYHETDEVLETFAAPDPSPEDVIERIYAVTLVSTVLRDMTRSQRKILLTALKNERLGDATSAAELGMTIATYKPRLSRARAAARKIAARLVHEDNVATGDVRPAKEPSPTRKGDLAPGQELDVTASE